MRKRSGDRERWTAAEVRYLRRKFPTMDTAYMAKEMERSVSSIRTAAFTSGLKKTKKDLASMVKAYL
jgi:hypothetical protein